MKKRALALLLALVMVFALAACTSSNGDETENPVDNTESPSQDPVNTDEPNGYEGLDYSTIQAMDYDDASDAIYDRNLGEFYEYYQVAKAEVDNTDLRLALMAIAEAKLMESGVFLPVYGDGGNYAMTRVVPRSGTTTSWGLDEYKYYTYLITNELIKAEDRTALVTLWSEAEDNDAWFAAARAFLEEHGYTLNDVYNWETSYQPSTWDVIASSYTADSLFVAPTISGLLEYDAKNNLQPGLAESYEVSADGLTYTFHIRQGVNWVDQQGRVIGEVTADDWVASMQHLVDNYDDLGYLMSVAEGCGIKNFDAYMDGDITDFSLVGVEAVDDYTLVYTLESKFPAFDTMFGYGCFAPLNRSFYRSLGGTFSTEGEEYTPGTYGTGPSTIAYCGAYVVTNYTAETICTYSANPEYWNADAVNVKTVNYIYNDGSIATRSYEDAKAGTATSCGFNASALELAKTEIPEGETATYFDLYGYTTTNSATTYCGWMNMHRGIWNNFDDETAVVSPMRGNEDENARTFSAMNNQNFRLALAFSVDRASYNAIRVGEALKYASLKNSYVTGSFDYLDNDVTVDINGTSTTFKAGTFYGEIMQAQIDADGYPIKVWDPNGDDGLGSGDGFDGWFSVANAQAYLNAAIEELAQTGVEVSADKPIYIDYPYAAYSESSTNMAQALKQIIEGNLENKVILNLVEMPDRATMYSTSYYYTRGYEANFDFCDGSGWGPDYGDPQSFLNTVIPYGYMMKNMGMY